MSGRLAGVRDCRRGSRRLRPPLRAGGLPEMLEVITHAAGLGRDRARAGGLLHLWRELDRQQSRGPGRAGAPLLPTSASSLVERTVLDALCRLAGEPLHRMIREKSSRSAARRDRPALGFRAAGGPAAAEPLHLPVASHRGPRRALTATDLAPEERVVTACPSISKRRLAATLQYFSEAVRIRTVTSRGCGYWCRCSTGRPPSSWHSRSDGNENFTTRRLRDYWQRAAPDVRSTASGLTFSSSNSRCTGITR